MRCPIRARRAAALLLVSAAALFVSTRPGATQTTTATLQGVVRDASGAPLPGVSVTLRDRNTGFVRTATSERSGTYFLTYVPAGTYDVTFDLAGFKTVKVEAVRFEVGQETTLDVALDVAPVAETVTVRGEAPLVEPTKSTVDKVISREQIDDLPINGRQASTLATLAPGVVPRTGTEEPVTSGGQPRGSGEMLLDGVSTKMMAVNSIRSNPPPDAIQEFQVLTTQYAAEFGNATGIILNTITRSGTNEVHGRAYYFHRDEAWDAKNAFATSKAAFEQKQGGGWIGGPIVRDRTHYFASYEATRRDSIATVTSPLAPGDVKQPFDNNQLLVKLSHQLTANQALTGRVSLDRPTQHNAGVGGIYLPEVGTENRTEDLAYLGTLASVLSSRALNELRVQVARTNVSIGVSNPDAYSINRPTSFGGKLPNAPQAFREHRFQLVDNLAYEAGRHRIKVGADFNRVSLDGYVYQYNPGMYVFTTDAPFDANDPSTYPLLLFKNVGETDFAYTANGLALFAQDAWRLPHHVTVNIGLRYDRWNMEGLDLQKRNFSPRVGFAWDPTGAGRTSIRGGYGVFYGNTNFNLALLANWLGKQRILQIFMPGYPDPGTTGVNLGAADIGTYISQPDQPLPRSYNTTVGVQRELWKGVSVSADYVHSAGRKLVRFVQTNPVGADFRRADPTRGSVIMLQSSGYSNYDGLLVGATGRFGPGTVGLAYTLSRYKTTNDAENVSYYQNDATPDDAYGYGNFDRRHVFVVNGTAQVAGGIQLAAVLAMRSGTPFDITTGRDNNRNGVVNDRPDLAAGARVGTDDMRNRSSFVDPGARPGNLPRNAGRGPGFWQLDMRLARRFSIQKTRAELMLEAFNVTNRTNLQNPIGNLASSSFGKSPGAGDARQIQLAFRFEF